MGMMNCPKHGTQVVFFTSTKIANLVNDNQKISFKTFKIKLNLPDAKTSLPLIDDEFFSSIQENYESGIKDNEILDEEISFEIFSELATVCPECLGSLTRNHD